MIDVTIQAGVSITLTPVASTLHPNPISDVISSSEIESIGAVEIPASDDADLANITNPYGDTKHSVPTYKPDGSGQGVYRVTIKIQNGKSMSFYLSNVSNQAGWTLDTAGLNQAVSDLQAAL